MRTLLISFIFSSLVFAIHQPGSPSARKGGSLTYAWSSYPKAILLYLANEDAVEGINEYVFDSLITVDLVDYEPIPRIAKKWKVSPDKLTYTFYLDPDAKFSDGKPVTAEDVKFTWDTIFDPKHKTAPVQSLFGVYESVKVIDPMTVEFKAKVKNYQNLVLLRDFFILPKHYFSQGDFNKDFNTKLLGSGPYLLSEVKQGEKIVLKRNPDYWAAKHTENIGRYNLDSIIYKVNEDHAVRYELLKKGELDYYEFYMAKMWMTETDGPLFENGYLKKIKGENKFPYSMSGISWNLRKPLFQDRKVRIALGHLMNREKMISELFYKNYVMATGVMGPTSEYHSPNNKPIPYDVKKAQALLKEAGWNKVGDDGVLVKDGLRFEFEIVTSNASFQRFLTIYQEDLKKVGIKMNIRIIEWATGLKMREEGQFDGFIVAWTREVSPFGFDRQWGSKTADIKGSDNFSGYKNPEIDKLAAEVDVTFDKKKRIKLVQKIDEIIGHDQPWTFLWELTYFRIAHWNKYSFPKDQPYLPYSISRNAIDYWWYDEAKDMKVKEAKEKNAKVTF